MPRATSWKRRWKKPAPPVEHDEELDALAFKIAMAYKNLLKVKVPFGLPWSPKVKVRDTIHWAHFLKAAKIVQEHGGTAQEFVRGQWDGVCRLARRRSDRVLFPQMLGTDNARMRHIEFLGTSARREDRRVKKKHIIGSDFSREDRRLAALRIHHEGEDDESILALHCVDFSRSYLQHKGVWDAVAESYERALNDT